MSKYWERGSKYVEILGAGVQIFRNIWTGGNLFRGSNFFTTAHPATSHNVLHTLPCTRSTFLCCHCSLEAFQIDQPLPMCNLHSIKSQETRVRKNVSSKNKGRCRDGAVCL